MTSDDVISYVGPKGTKGNCRVRVYEPGDAELDATVVLVSDLTEDSKPGIREATSTIAARVAASFHLYERPVFIDHCPPEDFELVWFARYRAQEIRCMGPHLLWDLEVGEPERKQLDRRTVELLVGQPV